MEKDKAIRGEVEAAFLTLPPEEREAVISHGVALRLSDLKKRLFLAESKVRHFEEKYKVTLADLEAGGLADDADYEMHENYVMWRHWAGVEDKAKRDIVALEKIAIRGLYLGGSSHAGH
jgi:hypothetical protein